MQDGPGPRGEVSRAHVMARPFVETDEPAVIELWGRCDLLRPWNDPSRDIRRKLSVQRELFLVGELNGRIVCTAMAGYDGHRGWVNYLAVDPNVRRGGLGRWMMAEVETRLRSLGCPKINLQVRAENKAAVAFYERLGFKQDQALSFGKRLESDD